MPLPLAVNAYTIYNNISQASKYYYLELRQGTNRTISVSSGLMADGENSNSLKIFPFVQGLKKSGLATIGTLPKITLDWDYTIGDAYPEAEVVLNDRTLMSDKMFLFYALRSDWGNSADGSIIPADFITKWGITQDFFLENVGAIAVLNPIYTAIPITWTDRGFLNLASLTQAQILSTLADYYGDSLIYTYIVLQALRPTATAATQTVDPVAIATNWKIPAARVNTHLIQLQSKAVIDLVPGEITLTWISKPTDSPMRSQVLERRGKVYNDAGYCLYALALEPTVQILTSDFITRWMLTEQQFFDALEILRAAKYFNYAVASSTIRWLI